MFERFEGKLQEHGGQLLRAAVELAKDWRMDRNLRQLQALLAVADKHTSLLVSGTGDVIEPEHDLISIGSGGDYARAAALALLEHSSLDARTLVEQALTIASEICVFTNQELVLETLYTAFYI